MRRLTGSVIVALLSLSTALYGQELSDGQESIDEDLPLCFTGESPPGGQSQPEDPGATIRCTRRYGITGPATATQRDGSGARAPSDIRYVPYERIARGADGELCATTGYRALQPGQDAGAAASIDDRDLGNILATYPPCPAQPAAPADSPAVYAGRFWRETPLPEPRPHIAPGRAITGMLAYLETRGSLAHTYTSQTPVGPLVIAATGRYYVDWGDGTTTGPHGIEGLPWPDGRITHQYVDVGAYDVVVTERWTARWRLGGDSGILSELRTTGRIDDFPVQQIQAVRYR